MPRGNRHFLPGYLWHLTHRCHKREFLLGFKRDRRRYVHWLFEAKKRYAFTILNYVVTSSHIHLLVEGGEERKAIPRGMQLVAGRVAQEYNIRKGRGVLAWRVSRHGGAERGAPAAVHELHRSQYGAGRCCGGSAPVAVERLP
jgi:REP element-mobilizing transposase RayT